MSDRAAPPAIHGGLVADELRAHALSPGAVLDFSVNVNPYGPCPAVRDAVAAAAIDRYPDPTAAPARRALALRVGVDPVQVVLSNGAAELLWAIARIALRPGDRALVVEPAFSELRRAATAAGATVLEHRTAPERDFALDLAALDTAIRSGGPKLVYAATPSNPAGMCVPTDTLHALAGRHPGALFVVDVSFLSVSDRHGDGERLQADNLVWVRSLTKDHALAGLRVGYAVAPRALAARLERDRPPWSVSALAQAAAEATTLEEAERFLAGSRTRWMEDGIALARAVPTLGLRFHPSQTVYLLVDLGKRARATDLRQQLLRHHGVLVRDATSFGLPHHIRLAARPPADRVRLMDALRAELA